ncbi:uncharacterized protein LOC113042195 isoform X2 [Carassius auratus]|uniref:Uncharacterized protein LOC113042195 isoform X2 n=1 Tax=Carassius auratus TaxID=7957 RepID=A0A6P6J8B9_CARAU|nr:uncharacterized protein LOC113042195 isoform X2 [Carassius auratus]XP_026056609.1 uncharacterized protein LOC113042195 isoform X2 [Carassius auratus]XP_026056610.1 uncharacterized protein LOC113042195 isoform X2 [Carassius auratus]
MLISPGVRHEPGPGRRPLHPPPPVFRISTRTRFAPLCETEDNTVIIGDSIVRHVRAMLAEGKVHTHCFPGAHVLDISAQIPVILKGEGSIGVDMLHAGVNDNAAADGDTEERLQEPDRDDAQHIACMMIFMSGPLPIYRRGHERFSRLFALNEWLLSWCKEQKLLFVNNWDLFWERLRLFRSPVGQHFQDTSLHMTRQFVKTDNQEKSVPDPPSTTDLSLTMIAVY